MPTHTWTQLGDPPSGARRIDSTSFTIDGLGYCVGGRVPPFTFSEECWSYDPDIDTWAQVASHTGTKIRYSVSLTIHDPNYSAGPQNLGYQLSGNPYLGNYWQGVRKYDYVLDTWFGSTSLPANQGRQTHFGFVINNEIYICGGNTSPGSNGQICWQFTPLGGWTQKATMSSLKTSASGMSMQNGKGYVAFGGPLLVDFKTFEYDPVGNSWTQKADTPTTFGLGAHPTDQGTTIEGYILHGKAARKYNPIDNEWTTLSGKGGESHVDCPVNFLLNNFIYFGLGTSHPSGYSTEFWMLDDGIGLNTAPFQAPSVRRKPPIYDITRGHVD